MDPLALIEAVKMHPELWSKEVSSTGNMDQKCNVWREISAKVNQPVDKCKAKWRNLRDSYLKSIKWREDLAEVGKLEKYRGYKHEEALTFLGSAQKRKSGSEHKRSRQSKRLKEEIIEEVEVNDPQQNEDYSPSAQAVEFLIESQDGNQQEDTEEEDEQEVQMGQEIEEHYESMVEVTKHEIEEPQYLTYENSINNETVLTQEEIHHQRAIYEYKHDTQFKDSQELDSWFVGVKSTLLKLPRLLRARTRKQINELISDVEIKFLEEEHKNEQRDC